MEVGGIGPKKFAKIAPLVKLTLKGLNNDVSAGDLAD